MSTSGINFERLDAAITYGFDHPDEFDMGTWFERLDCGTTACLAGTLAVQAGYRPVWDEARAKVCNGDVVSADGEVRDIVSVGAELLNLDVDGAHIDALFFLPTLTDVIDYRNKLALAEGVSERTWSRGGQG